MKFDKETLLKNRFWVLLCVAAPLALIDIILLGVVVPGQTTALKKKNDTEHSKIAKFSTIANQKWIDQAQKGLDKAKKEEKIVWENAWLAQEDLYTWPGELQEPFKQGYFAKAIVLYPGETKAEELKPAESESRYYGVFHGKILNVAENNESIRVQSLKPLPGTKGLTVRQFFNPGPNLAKISVAGKDAEKPGFDKLRNYQGHKVVITYEKGKAFGDELTEQEQLEFSKKYVEQIVPILREVGPLNELKEPVVQFKGWDYSEKPKELFFQEGADTQPNQPVVVRQGGGGGGNKDGANRGAFEFFPYVPKGLPGGETSWKHFTQGFNSTKDAWTFQENLWVMREMFKQLHTVNQEIATFQPKGISGGEEPTFYFENPYWRLELKPLPESKLGVTIKNLTDRRQKIPTLFKVKLGKDKNDKNAKVIKLPPFKSPALAAKGVVEVVEKDGKKYHRDTFPQVFEPPLVIDLSDQLRGASPKTVLAVEQMLTWETAGVKRIDAVHLGTPSAQSHRTVNRPLKSFFKEEKKEEATDPGGKKPAPGAVVNKNLDEVKVTENGMVLERYLDVTPQSRRLPVALVVVVDQDQVYRIQAALADCNFRFLTTQVVQNRCPDSMRPTKTGVQSPVEEPSSGNQQETNVELVIYGVITLYERYPPRPTTP